MPQPLRGFFEANLVQIRDQSGQEPPGQHYIHMDDYPEFFTGTFPRDINELIAIYGTSTVNGNGKAPWTFASYVQSLTSAMAAAAGPEDWAGLIPIAAAQAHYIEDLHNPLHLTYNYDGQYTGNGGIHARYEGEMIVRHLSQLTFEAAPAQYLPDVVDFVFDEIEEHYYFLDDILAADDASPRSSATEYYNSMWSETGAFTQMLFQEASGAVASSWYSAWINAGSPRTFLEYSADFTADGQVNGEDLLEWQSAYGITGVADADGDGDSDGRDFLAWQRQYASGTAVVANSSALPEPSAMVMAGVAMLLMGSSIHRPWG